jgi:hypothetical protein
VYATIPDSFDEKEIDLLFEVGQGIAFVLHSSELEEESKRAKEGIAKTQRRKYKISCNRQRAK